MLIAVADPVRNLVDGEIGRMHQMDSIRDAQICDKILERHPQFLLHDAAQIRRIASDCFCCLRKVQPAVIKVRVHIFSGVSYDLSALEYLFCFSAHLPVNIRGIRPVAGTDLNTEFTLMQSFHAGP